MLNLISVKRRTILCAALASAVSSSAFAQTPALKILVGFPPGGSIDTVTRLVAEKMKDELKQPVIVENKPGAGGRLVAELLKNAAPDGTTVMVTPVVVPVLAPLVFSKLNYDPKTDFAPVGHVNNFSFALAVKGDSPYKNVGDFVAAMKTNPQVASFGSPAAGSLPHFFGLLLGKEAKADMVHVAYNGGAPLQTAVLGGQVLTGIDVLFEFLQNHKAGKARIIATSGEKRSAALPDVPTFAEQGFPNIVGGGWFAMFAPSKTPTAEIDRLNRALNKALSAPDVRERMISLALEPGGGSPADLQKLVDADIAKWGPIVKASGFKAD